MVDNKAWLTTFDNEFDADRYLYHYTNVSTALKIIDGNSLKFSKINRTNDTLESKLKIDFENVDKDTYNTILTWIQSFNDKYSSDLQLLCFSVDEDEPVKDVSFKTKLSDYSRRGFAKPRMWAQYASNNEGVCLIFDKERIISRITEELGDLLIDHKRVKYKDQLFSFKFSDRTVNQIKNNIRIDDNSIGFGIQCHSFLQRNNDFTDYNYFHKLDDWKGEKEYRFLSYYENDLFIENSNDALVGVIIGERIDKTNEHLISMICNEICEVKKITFTIAGSQLYNVHLDE